jgi:hypothetical protein
VRLLLVLMLSAPLAASAAKPNPGGLSLKGDGGVELGMSRADALKAIKAMADGKLEPYELTGCTTSELLTYTTSTVFATAVIRFDRILGEDCDIPVRTDKAYNIELDFVDGVDGQKLVDEHLKAFGKPYKREGGPDSGVAYYEWRKMPHSVMLAINLRDGTAIRKEIRDIGVDKEIKKIERPLMQKELREKREKLKEPKDGL